MSEQRFDNRGLYLAALAGDVPAEVLSTNDRGALVAELVRYGMDDARIAKHTGWSYLTARRVRESRNILPVRREVSVRA